MQTFSLTFGQKMVLEVRVRGRRKSHPRGLTPNGWRQPPTLTYGKFSKVVQALSYLCKKGLILRIDLSENGKDKIKVKPPFLSLLVVGGFFFAYFY